MLNNKSKKLPNRPNSNEIPQDPWSIPSTVPKANPLPETWHLATEPYSLISPAGNPKAPRLVSHHSTSGEILLEDELKLKISAGSLLKQQVEKALALLFMLIRADKVA